MIWHQIPILRLNWSSQVQGLDYTLDLEPLTPKVTAGWRFNTSCMVLCPVIKGYAAYLCRIQAAETSLIIYQAMTRC